MIARTRGQSSAKIFGGAFMLQDAIQNAEIIHQKRTLNYKTGGQADNDYPVCRWNSYTNLHKLVEAMKLQSKN
jgi:hypothetical protein